MVGTTPPTPLVLVPRGFFLLCRATGQFPAPLPRIFFCLPEPKDRTSRFTTSSFCSSLGFFSTGSFLVASAWTICDIVGHVKEAVRLRCLFRNLADQIPDTEALPCETFSERLSALSSLSFSQDVFSAELHHFYVQDSNYFSLNP